MDQEKLIQFICNISIHVSSPNWLYEYCSILEYYVNNLRINYHNSGTKCIYLHFEHIKQRFRHIPLYKLR